MSQDTVPTDATETSEFSATATTEMPTHSEFDRSAIARITVVAGAQTVSRGTGTLVGERLVLSALHVVANRRAEPPEPFPGAITLEFPEFTTQGTIINGAWDRIADWVLIECADAPSARPMPMASLVESKRRWDSYGFPEANKRDGLLLSGDVVLCEGELEGTRAHQLYCPQAAGGGGGRVKGMSGAPLVVDGRLVGVMRFALMEQDRTEMGTLYACPAAAVSAKWPALDVPMLPRTRKQRSTEQLLKLRAGWELFALTGALVLMAAIVLALSRLPMRAMGLYGRVSARDARFTLLDTATLRLDSGTGMVRVSSLSASSLSGVERTGPNSRVDVGDAEFALPKPASDSNELFIDLGAPLKAGTRVWLAKDGDVLGRYRLQLDSLRTPLRVQYRGAVKFKGGDEDWTTWRSVDDHEVRLTPANMQLNIGFTLATASTRQRPDGAFERPTRWKGKVSVRALNFQDVKESDAPPGKYRVPTVDGGLLVINGPDHADSLQLAEEDSLAFDSTTVLLTAIRIPGDSGTITAEFRGNVRAAAVGINGGAVVQLMPSWLHHLTTKYALQSALAAMAFTTLIASLVLVHLRRRKM